MQKMDMSIEFLRALMEPLGITPRAFIVDYQDENGNSFYEPLRLLMLDDDSANATIVRQILETYKGRGFTVCTITELLNGFTKDALEQMPDKQEMLKNIRSLYVNPD